jgi:hypothetical protein
MTLSFQAAAGDDKLLFRVLRPDQMGHMHDGRMGHRRMYIILYVYIYNDYNYIYNIYIYHIHLYMIIWYNMYMYTM